jgi:hypothetical protein
MSRQWNGSYMSRQWNGSYMSHENAKREGRG